jgi:predicted SAM-dependent methyltransferase
MIFKEFYEPRFIDDFKFEIKSFIGRTIFKRKSKITAIYSNPLLVDIGVGGNYKEKWVHIDFYRIRIKFWKKKIMPRPEVETDLRYPLNCEDDIVDGVYSGHTLEHLYPNQAINLLKEIYRVLKPGCWLRINVPDLKYSVDFYNGYRKSDKYKYGAEAICNLALNWGHHSVWDEELLIYALEKCGFINVKTVEYGKNGNDKRLIKEEEIRRTGTIVIEAQKK